MCPMSNKFFLTSMPQKGYFPATKILLWMRSSSGSPLNTLDSGDGSVGPAVLRLGYRLFCQVVLFFTAVTCTAQTFTTVSGTVLDPSGAAVGNAQVSILNEGTGARRSTTSGTYGI